MAKTRTTLEIERALYNRVNGRAQVACREVTLGMYGDNIVDFITINLDKTRIITCYEIKVSKSDFYSGAKLSFMGDKNYFVMPDYLYEQVKQDIPSHVGCYLYSDNQLINVKYAKKVKVEDRELIFLNTLRSFNREYYKALGIRPYQDNKNWYVRRQGKGLGTILYKEKLEEK